MFLQYALGSISLLATWAGAFVGSVSSVNPQMCFKYTFFIECFVAISNWAFEYLVSSLPDSVRSSLHECEYGFGVGLACCNFLRNP